MAAVQIDPLSCALFLMCAFTLAGIAQTMWFRSTASRRFMAPLDGGLTIAGHRLFGANKTVRGFLGMVPAAAVAFVLLAALAGPERVTRAGLWPLSSLEYAALGAVAGFGFMAGELPNSFVKRQLGIGEGERPEHRGAAVAQFIADRLDSGIGMLAATSVVVPVPHATWAAVLTIGPAIHWGFSVVMFRLGIKHRPA